MPSSFTRTWDAAWEAIPAASEKYNLGAQRLREIKIDISERFQDEGVFLKDLAGTPSNVGTGADQGDGALYDNAGDLWYQDSAGNDTQITKNGAPYLHDGLQYIWGWVAGFTGSGTPVFAEAGSISVSGTSGSTAHGITGNIYSNSKVNFVCGSLKHSANGHCSMVAENSGSGTGTGADKIAVDDTFIYVETPTDVGTATFYYLLVYEK